MDLLHRHKILKGDGEVKSYLYFQMASDRESDKIISRTLEEKNATWQTENEEELWSYGTKYQ